MEQFAFLLVFVAPALQLVLSYYRGRHKIIIPVALTGILALALGAGLSYLSQYIDNRAALDFDNHSAPPASLFYYGLLVTGISVPLITLVFTIVYYIKREVKLRRKKKAAANAVAAQSSINLQ